jgi:hypothetical protein
MAGRPKLKSPYNKLVNFIVTEEMFEKLKEKAEQEGMSVSMIVRRLVKDYLGINIEGR